MHISQQFQRFLSPRTSVVGLGICCFLLTFIIPCSAQSGRRVRRGKYKTIEVKAYRWVQGKGGYGPGKKFSYPAPGGEEDNEMVYATRTYVQGKLNTLSPEWTTGFRNPQGTENGDPRGDPGVVGPGWWFSQAVGNDSESYGTHLADFKVTQTVKGKTITRYFSAAFDVVLTTVPIFQESNPTARRSEFGPYVKIMRNNGIVAWHRWAGESASTSENEMHCIDPASPFIKRALNNQIDSFLRGETGGQYPPEPEIGNFAITEAQSDAVRLRRSTKLVVPGAVADNIRP